MISNEPRRSVLVVSTSARQLTQSAARAGYSVDAIDQFGDEDTRAVAARVATVRAGTHGFDNEDLAAAIADMLRGRVPSRVVYGSGFEAEPELIERLFAGVPIAGNSAATVRAVKDSQRLSESLLAAAIATPAVLTEGHVPGTGWLIKRCGASGGEHIRTASAGESIPAGSYAQRFVTGQSMSALFLSDAIHCRLVGACTHWCAQPQLLTPFQHSGMISTLLDAPLAATITRWGERCTRAFGLRGIWGMDFILDGRAEPFLIEINPRPPASMELFDRNGALFAAHIGACAGEWVEIEPPQSPAASAVFYAPRAGRLPESFAWPEGFLDRPAGGASFKHGQPLCTVYGEGMDSAQLLAMMSEKIAALQHLIGETSDYSIKQNNREATSDKIL